MTRDEYKRALAAIEDTDHVRSLMRNLSVQLAPLFGYSTFKHPPEAAIQVVCEAKYALAEILSDFEELDRYEEEQKEEIENGR